MKQLASRFLVASISSLLLIIIMAQSADAIPPFSRKYRTSCQTCHVMIFKRNPFGEAFRRNGYFMPVDDEMAVKEEPVPLGTEAWKKVWPKAVWPGFLPQTVPIGFYVHQRVTFTEERPGKSVVKTQFDMPHELEMLIGGTIGDHVSFFGEWILFELGHTDLGRLGDLKIQYNDLFGPEDAVNVKIGRSDVSGLDGYYAFKEGNRLTLAHYLTNDYRVVPSKDAVNGDSINYRWRYRDKQSGIEVNGILMERFEYAVGFVNGNTSTKDTNNHKDFHFRTAFKLGGETMTMKTAPGGGELAIQDNWRDDSVTFAFHGYIGETLLATSQLSWVNKFKRYGADIRAKYDRFELGAAYVWGRDDNPAAPPGLDSSIPTNVNSSSWFLDASVIIFPWLIPTIRYEQVNFEGNFANDSKDIVVNINALFTANIRWTVEWVHFLDDDDGADNFKINLLFAF